MSIDLPLIPPAELQRPSSDAPARGINPLFLISAVCMLAGLFTLNSAYSNEPLRTDNLLRLILTLGVYELMLVGAGWCLYRLGAVRDALTLFVIEIIFIADLAMLNSELFNQSFRSGLVVHAALLLLAMSKLGVMLHVMGAPLFGAMMRLSILQLLLLSIVPGLLRWMADQNRGVVDPMALHAVWWMISAVVVVVAIEWDRLRDEMAGRHGGVLVTLLIVPAISLIVHVATAHWVHKTPWHAAHLAPLAMAGACALALRLRDPAHRLAKLQLMLPVLAVILTWGAPTSLSIEMLGTTVTPLRIVFAVSVVVYLIAAVRMWHVAPLVGSVISTVLTFAGQNPKEIGQSTRVAATHTRGILERYWPSDSGDWGVIAITAAFAALMLGIVISALRARVDQRDASSP